MKLTKVLEIIVTGKTKQECEEVFKLIKSYCDVEVRELEVE
jgi:hypothetical protein